jgi:hypothetical protein
LLIWFEFNAGEAHYISPITASVIAKEKSRCSFQLAFMPDTQGLWADNQFSLAGRKDSTVCCAHKENACKKECAP